MLRHRITTYTLLTGITLLTLLFIAACGVSAYQQQIPRAVNPPAAPEPAAAEIATLSWEIAAVKAQLAQLTHPSLTVWSATITPQTNAGNVIWTRANGETLTGTIASETDIASNSRLLKIQLTTASGNLTITTPGPAANFTDKTLRINDRYLPFQTKSNNSTYSSMADETDWTFTGSYAAWYQTTVAHSVAVLQPITPPNLLPSPIPASAALPDHLLGYQNGVNQTPLSLLDARYRQQVPTDASPVLSFPANPTNGQSVILLHPDSVPQFAAGAITESNNIRTMPVTLTIPGGGISSLQGYAPAYTRAQSASLRNKVFVITSGSPTSLPANLSYQGTNYPINQTPVPNLPGYYQVTNLTYASLTVAATPKYNFTLADGTQRPHRRHYQPDPYTYNGSSWERTPGSVSQWAESGNQSPIPLSKLPPAAAQILHAGPATGIKIANSSQTSRAALTAFTPTFNLDTAGQQRGIITYRAQLRLSNPTPNTLGFTDNTANPQRGHTFSGYAFLSQIKATPNYAAAAANGIQIGQAPIRNGSVTLGALSLYLVHDANNNLGYYLNYAGTNGTARLDLDLSNLEIGFIPNDKPRSIQGGKLATWTAQTTAPTGSGRKADWNVESSQPGTGSVQAQPGDRPNNQQTRIRVDHYNPTEQCFGWLFIAKVGGTEIARAVVPLIPPGVSTNPVRSGYSESVTRLNLVNNRFLLLHYTSTGDGQDRFNIGPQPTSVDSSGRATAWTPWPANLTVELYEAITG